MHPVRPVEENPAVCLVKRVPGAEITKEQENSSGPRQPVTMDVETGFIL